MNSSIMDDISTIRTMINHLEGALECVDRIENRARLNLHEKERANSPASLSTDSDDSDTSDSVKCVNDEIEVVELSDSEEQPSEKETCMVAPTREKVGSGKRLKVKHIQELTNSSHVEKTPTVKPTKHPTVCSLYYKAFVFNLPEGSTVKSVENWLQKKDFHDIVDIMIQSKVPYPVAVVSFASKEMRDNFLKMDSEEFGRNEVKVKVYIDEWSPVDDLLTENAEAPTKEKEKRIIPPKKKKKYVN